MRLTFTILWIDDQPKYVQSLSEGIKADLAKLGFQLDVVPVESFDQVRDKVAAHVHDDRIDLVLVDYDLGNRQKSGVDAAAQVRKQMPYKEVIFYSATESSKLRQLAFKAGIDNVHFANRRDLVQDTAAVINKLLHRVLDLDHMRGLVVAASSDIDHMVQASLVALHGRMPRSKQRAFLSKLCKELKVKLSGYITELTSAKKSGDFAALLGIPYVYTASDRLTSLIEQLDTGAYAKKHVEKAKSYQSAVVPRRNRFAHAALVHGPDRKPKLVGVASNDCTTDAMAGLRRKFIEHRRNFEEIAALVDANLDGSAPLEQGTAPAQAPVPTTSTSAAISAQPTAPDPTIVG